MKLSVDITNNSISFSRSSFFLIALYYKIAQTVTKLVQFPPNEPRLDF